MSAELWMHGILSGMLKVALFRWRAQARVSHQKIRNFNEHISQITEWFCLKNLSNIWRVSLYSCSCAILLAQRARRLVEEFTLLITISSIRPFSPDSCYCAISRSHKNAMYKHFSRSSVHGALLRCSIERLRLKSKRHHCGRHVYVHGSLQLLGGF